MAKSEIISPWQLILLIFLSRIIIAITYLPSLNEPPANQDVWMSEITAFALQLLFSIPVYLLHKRFPYQTLAQYSQTIFGKFFGGLIALVVIAYFLYIMIITLARLNTFVTTAIMPETPQIFFTITMVAVSAYLVSKGLKVLGRLAGIFAVLLILSVSILLFLLFSKMDFHELTPVYDTDILSVLTGGVTILTKTIEILALSMVLPYISDRKQTKKVLYISYGMIFAVFVTITISVQATLGVEGAKSATFPYFSAIKNIEVFDFIERTEALDFAVWVLGIFIKVSFYFYISALGISQVFHLKSYKPLIIPLAVAAVPLTMFLIPNLNSLRAQTDYHIFVWPYLAIVFVIPLVLLVAALVQKKGVNQE